MLNEINKKVKKGNHLDRVCLKSFSWGQGVGFYPFSGGQLPNFQGKSPGILSPIRAMAGTR